MSRVQKMLEIVNKPEYQPGVKNANGEPSTWCNHAAIEIADTLGFETRHLLNPGGVGWTNANDIFKNARSASLLGTIRILLEMEVVESANHGGLVIVCAFNIIGGSGHVAVVAPQEVPYKKMECPIVQAGAKNGIFDLDEIFNVPELTPPLFIGLRRKL